MIAIIQKGYSIYGTGSDIAAAVVDANEWLSSPLNIGRPENNYFLPSLVEADDGEICWADCTDRLANAVQENGDVTYEVEDNKIDISCEVVAVETFEDFVEVRPLENAATDCLELTGFQVDIKVKVGGWKFHVVFQSVERRDGMKAYNGYEVDHGLCDACQYFELSELLGDDSEFLVKVKKIATDRSRDELDFRR